MKMQISGIQWNQVKDRTKKSRQSDREAREGESREREKINK